MTITVPPEILPVFTVKLPPEMLPVEVNDSTVRGTVEKLAELDTTRFAVVKFAFDTMFCAIKLPVNDKLCNPVVMFAGRSIKTDCDALVNTT